MLTGIPGNPLNSSCKAHYHGCSGPYPTTSTGETGFMLSILRKHAGSWFIKFILAFIALTFVWWGVGTYSERERELAATVGSTRITMSELGEAMAGLEKSYRDVYGNAFTPEMAKALDLRRQALDGLVQRALFLAEAKTMGIVA